MKTRERFVCDDHERGKYNENCHCRHCHCWHCKAQAHGRHKGSTSGLPPFSSLSQRRPENSFFAQRTNLAQVVATVIGEQANRATFRVMYGVAVSFFGVSLFIN